ncbi:MAG: Metalloprotease MmpA [Chlamydiae bacterium]|nr:Metalloprotease MmpA [Chlamydiota bacterium]
MTILYFVLAAAALGILVFIHELGHYYVARRVGMTVEVFSIGFGRAVLKWKVNGVAWQLGWLPFGGYVKIAGMELTKKDKKTYIEPHEIPGGFFANAPWKRIAVALAGPVANLILAFLIFAVIFAMGGREKPFSEFTRIIGWVDPSSELYVHGVRPGDILTHYDGQPYTSSKDLLYAAMLSDRNVNLQGYHVDYATGERRPFSYTIETYQSPASPDGILTTGISNVSRYFNYDKLPGGAPNPLLAGSPLEESGIQYGDRLVWIDGQLLFSREQLRHIINDGRALLTVKRGDSHFITRQPRVKADDLMLPGPVKNELSDWQYAAGIEGRWQELKVVPYNLSPDGVVTSSLEFIDEDTQEKAFPRDPLSRELEQPLEVGDQIVAIDGTAITTSYQLLDLLQTRKVELMVDLQISYNARVH